MHKSLGEKVKLLIPKILLTFPAALGAVALRLLRPLVVIRLGELDVARIGGVCVADWYLSERAADRCRERSFDVFYFTTANGRVCNQQWLKLWKRVLRIVPFGDFFRMVTRISLIMPGHSAHVLPLDHVLPMETPRQRNRVRCIVECKRPHVAFTKEEELWGVRALRELGVPDNKPFVCFHARDAAYLDAMFPGRSWKYHDYRDSSINNYLLSVEELVRRGYAAVRVGAIVKEKLAVTAPDIIDYACNGKRTDFLDVYLGAKCQFFICSDTGISTIPEVFRRPVVYTNWTVLKRISPWVLTGLFIFKKFYSHKEKRFLNFSEVASLKFGNPVENILDDRQIELRENTPEEIRDVVLEMDQRLEGTWRTDSEDEELQQRFWALLEGRDVRSPDLRIGAEFLRKNHGLLD